MRQNYIFVLYHKQIFECNYFLVDLVISNLLHSDPEVVYENSFQIIGNNQQNLLKAINHAIIGRSLHAVHAVMQGMDRYVVYAYYRDMFRVLYFLEGKAKFRKDLTETGETLSTDLINFNSIFPAWYGRSDCLIEITDPNLKPRGFTEEIVYIYRDYNLYIPTIEVEIPASNNSFYPQSSYKFDSSDEFACEDSEQDLHSEKCTIS